MIARSNKRAEAEALDYIRTLVFERASIRLDESKHELIKARLGKRMRLRGIDALADYCAFLQTDTDREEMTHVIDALTTNFTHFMREPDHFEFLAGTAAPQLAAKGRPFRVWSAACSTGEEPYTIAFFLDDLAGKRPGFAWEITASDISTRVLAQAQAGIFANERIEALPAGWKKRYFQKGAGQWSGHCRVKPQIAAGIRFEQINLGEEYTHANSFDVIFCRNVMIYFDRATQQQIVRRLCRHLAPGGYLITGHSESLNGLDAPAQCVRPSIYRRQ